MRRIAVLLTIVLFAAACTSTEPEAPVTTTVATLPATMTTLAPVTTLDPCREVASDVSGYVAALGLDHLDLNEVQSAGPLAEYMPDQRAFAGELGMPCSTVFYAHSPFGEMVHAVAAWDDQHIYVAIGAFVKSGSMEADDNGLAVGLDRIATARLSAAAEDVVWANVHDWWIASTLDGIAAAAGDDPMAALGAWNRASADDTVYPVLQMGGSSGWGGPDQSYTLYPDGTLIARVHVGGFPRTFEDTKAAFQLSVEQVDEIEAILVATGVTEGETFQLENRGIIDAPSLWFVFRHNDLSYYGNVYAPGPDEPTPSRQQVVDLAARLDQLTDTLDGTAWVPDSFAVWVTPHGSYAESNTMVWPGSFDLAAAAGRRCTLLQGAQAAEYLEGVALIGDEYQDRYKTIFEYGDQTFQVIGLALLPGDTDRQFNGLSQCNTGDRRRADPVLGSWLWRTRGIDQYRMALSAECASCDGAVTLDGQSVTIIPGWGEFRTVDDLFALAMRDDVELVELTTDGYVGVPLAIEVHGPESGGSLRLLTSLFDSDQGRLDVGHDDISGTWMSIDGFDAWMIEGY